MLAPVAHAKVQGLDQIAVFRMRYHDLPDVPVGDHPPAIWGPDVEADRRYHNMVTGPNHISVRPNHLLTGTKLWRGQGQLAHLSPGMGKSEGG